MFHRSSTVLLYGIGLTMVAACDYDVPSSIQPANTARVDPQTLKEYRSRWLLAEEPPAAMGILELREQLSTEAENDGTKQAVKELTGVVVVGRIPVSTDGDTAAWDPGKAVFVMVDPADDQTSHDQAHDDSGEHHDCPYCNKDPLAARAMVQFLDEYGRPLQADARELFQIDGGELVVVQGDARLTAGTLVVSAVHLYVRR